MNLRQSPKDESYNALEGTSYYDYAAPAQPLGQVHAKIPNLGTRTACLTIQIH